MSSSSCSSILAQLSGAPLFSQLKLVNELFLALLRFLTPSPPRFILLIAIASRPAALLIAVLPFAIRRVSP